MSWVGSDRRARLPADWPLRREYVLTRDPICAVCGLRLSTEVDHVIPGDDHSYENLRGICDPCHRAKSAREGVEAKRARRARRFRDPEPHPGRPGGGF